MYVGLLKYKSQTFTHKGVDVPFPPSSTADGSATWIWRYTYDDAIDINMELECESFVGAITANITEDSIIKAEALIDGAVCGSYSAETGKRTGGVLTIPTGKKGSSVSEEQMTVHIISLIT